MSTESNRQTVEIERLQCAQTLPNGHRCGSPALKNEYFCYFHHSTRKPDPVDSAIGRRLRLLRHQRDTSLQAVADAAGVSVGYLSQIERGGVRSFTNSASALAPVAPSACRPLTASVLRS